MTQPLSLTAAPEGITIFCGSNLLLKNFNPVINTDAGQIIPDLKEISDVKDNTTLFYAAEGIRRFKLTVNKAERSLVFGIDLETEQPLDPDAGAAFDFDIGRVTGTVNIYPNEIWWTSPSFARSKKDWPEKGQLTVVKNGGGQIVSLLPLPQKGFSTYISSRGIELSIGCGGVNTLSGAFLSVYTASEPIKAIQENFKNARRLKAITVPLLSERAIPEFVDELGWCSWNAFYRDMNEEKFISKIKEFKEKNIPVKWVMIDDGWLHEKNYRLLGLEADPEKFPLGLRHFVSQIKSVLDVKVGVWHAFTAYWSGIAPGSELDKEYSDVLTTISNGERILSFDPEKAYKFWSDWHSFLKDCGIDMLKVDNQGSYMREIRGQAVVSETTRSAHEALERSISEHFGSPALPLINCMGNQQENVLNRPMSAVNRNSNDFFPDDSNNFASHIVQNAWNAPWHSMLYVCDFDMWWSNHPDAYRSAVLRALSGGPVYVSDKVGETDFEKIAPLCYENGKVIRFPNAAMPTYDCFFSDCRAAKKPLKLFNQNGVNFAVGVWNISDVPTDGEISISDIPRIDSGRRYLAYEYFSKQYRPFDLENSIKLSLKKGEVQAWSIYPIRDGKVKPGDCSKYFGAATAATREVPASSLLNS